MEDPKLLEWIDAYLLGTITPEDKTALEERMKSDPDFARLVNESRATFIVMQQARQRDLRRKMKDWDATLDNQKPSPWKKRFAILGFVAFIALFLVWVNSHYSAEYIAQRFYHHAVLPQIPFSTPEKMLMWKDGRDAFEAGDYPRAKLLFQSLLDQSTTYPQQTLNWYILLCDLSISGDDEAWHERLDVYKNSTSKSYAAEALQLKTTLASPLYRCVYRKILHPSFVGVKPSII